MSKAVSIADRADWLAEPGLQKLLATLSQDGEEARVAGGAVRNALLGQPVSDIDVATTTVPEETARRAEQCGFRVVPTGAEHGTMTVMVAGRPVEVTTLRADVETDGRHAVVRFGRDWRQDAERRDFTINGLYATADGRVIDLIGGLSDLERKAIRFIGDPEQRIREDYLRILRFFRFFAQYGSGRPDAEGLKACARLKEGIERLSAERVWAELKKLLGADDPSRALLWMRQAGVLTKVLPESEKWGIDAVHGLVAAERDLGWEPDALLRLEAIVPPDVARMAAMAERLKLSKAEAQRLADWAFAPTPQADAGDGELARMLYRASGRGVEDRLALALAAARAKGASDDGALVAAAGFDRQLAYARGWERPVMPVGGEDLKTLGLEPGPAMGKELKRLEEEWIASGFALDREALIAKARLSAPGEPG